MRIIIESRISMNGFNTILNTVKEAISELEDKAEELTHNVDKDKEKGPLKERLRNVKDRVSRSNTHIIFVPRRNNKDEGDAILKDLMTEYFPEGVKNTKSQINPYPFAPRIPAGSTCSCSVYLEITLPQNILSLLLLHRSSIATLETIDIIPFIVFWFW